MCHRYIAAVQWSTFPEREAFAGRWQGYERIDRAAT